MVQGKKYFFNSDFKNLKNKWKLHLLHKGDS